MEMIAQRRTANTVRRDGDRVISEVLWLDAARELVCGIEADIRTLAIQEAWIEVLKDTAGGAMSAEDAGAVPAEDSIPNANTSTVAEKNIDSVAGSEAVSVGRRQDALAAEKNAPARRTFGFLAGVPAFIEGKKIIRQNLTGPEDTIPSYLLQQCINGIIQAETYFFRERGFADEEGYNCYWDELEAGGCRMYSHPDPADLRWMDYVPPGPRTRSLFHRLKSTQIVTDTAMDDAIRAGDTSSTSASAAADVRDGAAKTSAADVAAGDFTNPSTAADTPGSDAATVSGTTAMTDTAMDDAIRAGATSPENLGTTAPAPSRLICRGTFTDSYHEILLQLTCDAATGDICEADITYLRAPGKACFDNCVHAADLTGRNLYNIKSADILEAAGRSEGCYHLVEMLKDIRMSVNECIATPGV